ncbi:cardiolipin synthase (CMP-forming) [uncultured Gammaproteobacteria bacterium]
MSIEPPLPMTLTVPNLLTLSRIAVIPAILGLLCLPEAWAAWASLTLFIIAAITDFLDGHIARVYQVESAFGRFLDPIADKLLVVACLFMFAVLGRIQGWAALPAVVILLREVLISGLREFLGGQGVILPVSELAKWKTAVQMVAIGLLILGDHTPPIPLLKQLGVPALWLAALFTVLSAWGYLRTGLTYMNDGNDGDM